MKKKIFIDEDQVTPLASLAEELAKMYDYRNWRVDGDVIYYTDLDGRQCRVDTSGFAQTLEDGEWKDKTEDDVIWGECFDWSDYVWAADEAGNTVMLHG